MSPVLFNLFHLESREIFWHKVRLQKGRSKARDYRLRSFGQGMMVVKVGRGRKVMGSLIQLTENIRK